MREGSITTIQWCSWAHQNDFSAKEKKITKKITCVESCWSSNVERREDQPWSWRISLGQLKFLYLSSPSPFASIFVTSSSLQQSDATCNLQLAIGIAAGHLVKQSAVVRKFVKPLDSGRLTMLTWMCEKRRFRTSKLTIGGAVFWWTLAHWKFRQFLAQLVTSRIC